MAATGYTPISLYYSTTAATAPTSSNLVAGELAINITDGKLYYKDNTGTVQVIASKAGNVNVASISFGTTGLTPNTSSTGAVTVAGTLVAANGGTGQSSYTIGDMLYSTGTTALSKLGIGTNGYIIQSNGTAPRWVNPATIPVGTASNIAGGSANVIPYQTAANTTSFTPAAPGTGAYLYWTGGSFAWANPAAGLPPGGVSGNIQFNSGGFSFGGVSTFSYNGVQVVSTKDLSVSGITVGVGNAVDSSNTALGGNALGSNSSGHYNIAVGTGALTSLTIGSGNIAIGYAAGSNISYGGYNVFIGYDSGYYHTTANYNTGVGYNALYKSTTSTRNAALGASSLTSTTTGSSNVAVGYTALNANTTGANNVAVGDSALSSGLTTSSNTSVGYNSMGSFYGSSCVALGRAALAGGDIFTPTNNTGSNNTAVGYSALNGVISGSYNCAIGYQSGNAISTGSKNSILGAYSGNQSGLNISTSSNYIVLSDGDGNPNLYIDNNKNAYFAGTVKTAGYTVATLPAGTVGMRAYVTDATSPTFLGTLTGGGSVTCPVFYNGSAWVAG